MNGQMTGRRLSCTVSDTLSVRSNYPSSVVDRAEPTPDGTGLVPTFVRLMEQTKVDHCVNSHHNMTSGFQVFGNFLIKNRHQLSMSKITSNVTKI